MVPAELFTGTPRAALTPVTALFVHGSWLHLLGNMLFLYVFGAMAEETDGPPRSSPSSTWAAATSPCSATRPPTPTPQQTLVGASGAISAVLGAFLLPVPQGPGDQPVPVPLLPAAAVSGLGGAALLGRPSSGWRRASATQGPGVAYLAHLVGFSARVPLRVGALWTYSAVPGTTRAERRAELSKVKTQPRPPRETTSRDHRDRAHQDQRGPDPRDRRVDRRAGQRQRGLLRHRYVRPDRHGPGEGATTTWRTSSPGRSARSRAWRGRTRTSRSARTRSTTWRRRSRSGWTVRSPLRT